MLGHPAPDWMFRHRADLVASVEAEPDGSGSRSEAELAPRTGVPCLLDPSGYESPGPDGSSMRVGPTGNPAVYFPADPGLRPRDRILVTMDAGTVVHALQVQRVAQQGQLDLVLWRADCREAY